MTPTHVQKPELVATLANGNQRVVAYSVAETETEVCQLLAVSAECHYASITNLVTAPNV
jgi:hypothetical protein